MTFTPEFLELLKTRLRLSSIIGNRVKLKRKGRYVMGLCPFHREKTPSFMVNDAQATYHCFGCGAHGDLITFIQYFDKMSFRETVEKLASLAGISIPDSMLSTLENRQKTIHLKDIYDLLEEAASFFQANLRSPQGQKARNYLEKRGIKVETWEYFRLGFAPENNALKVYLLERGYSEEKLSQAGLLSKSEDSSKTYDRFRARLIFPIWNLQGRIVAFGGRLLDKGEPKYLNSPETELFHKGSLLYAYHFARHPAQQAERLIVCEGYIDVIALYQAGIKYAVAPLGTALTESQISLLWNLVPIPTLCFDGDIPGKKAALKTAERVLPLLKPGYSFQYAYLPDGEDPDSLIRRNQLKQLENILENSLPLVDVLWYQLLGVTSLKTPEARAQFEKLLMKLAQEIKDPLLRNRYKETFKERLFELFRFPNKSSKPSKIYNNLPFLKHLKPNFDSVYIQQKILFAGILNHPQLSTEYYEYFLDLEIDLIHLNLLRDEIISAITENPTLNSSNLQKHLEEKGFRELLAEILNEKIYHHASFVKPQTDIQVVKQGWIEVWEYLQEVRKMTNLPASEDNSLSYSLSPLLKAISRRSYN
jgi:DNA primase